MRQAVVFGKELDNTSIIIIYILLFVVICLLLGGIIYYWIYTRRLQRLVERDNEYNNMLRHELTDSFLDKGLQEWICSICFYENNPYKKECIMCGTPQIIDGQYRSSSDSNTGSREFEFFIASTNTNRSPLDRSKSSILNQQARIRSFHIRRLEEQPLNTRQKAALRRFLWRRKKGRDGNFRWVRIDDMETRTKTLSNTPQLLNSNQLLIIDKSETVSLSVDKKPDTTRHNEDIAVSMDELETSCSSPSMRKRHENLLLSSEPLAFPPLRETALKALEESCIEMESNIGLPTQRYMNSTIISIGYIRHDDGEGNIGWSPALHLSLTEDDESCEYDLEEIASYSFKDKTNWILKEIQKKWIHVEDGYLQLVIRRSHILADSREQIMKCPPFRFWERMRIVFENEPGLDAGGLIREWYDLLINRLFDDQMKLFIPTKGNNLGYWINPASKQIHPDYIMYYEFVGRLLGKAIIEGYTIKCSLALPLIKHLLGVPISYSDLEFLNEDLYKNTRWLKKNNGAELLALDFSVQELGPDGISSKTIDLKRCGRETSVTDANKGEYLELLLKYYMYDSISGQLTALLQGFYDLVPKYLVSVLDYQEFDLLLSGIPEIDIWDWQSHTDINWIHLTHSTNHEQEVIQWFWEVIEDEFNNEQRARLLQFVTGTSSVPVQGFKALTSSDGRVRRFCIHCIERGKPPTGLMPRAHTCFNRIDLPLYNSKEELHKFLTLVINMEITGFWLE